MKRPSFSVCLTTCLSAKSCPAESVTAYIVLPAPCPTRLTTSYPYNDFGVLIPPAGFDAGATDIEPPTQPELHKKSSPNTWHHTSQGTAGIVLDFSTLFTVIHERQRSDPLWFLVGAIFADAVDG